MLLHRGRSKDRKDTVSAKLPGPSFMSPQQVGQQSLAPTAFRSSSPLKFFSSSTVTQPGKSGDSQKKWTAEFLTDLRSNRPARPSGSRPLPVRNAKTTLIPTLETPTRPSSAFSRPICAPNQTEVRQTPTEERCASAMSHRRAQSSLSTRDCVGRPLAQEPIEGVSTRDFTATAEKPDTLAEGSSETTPPTLTYYERGERWMEKQEAKSLREALEDMDLKDEQRIHAAAQDEAAELVWKNRNSGVTYKNSDTVRDYKQHLRKGSHARSQSISRYGVLGNGKLHQEQSQRSVSDTSNSSKSTGDKANGSRVSSGSSLGPRKNHEAKDEEIASKDDTDHEASRKKAYMNLTFPLPPMKKSARRRGSGSRTRNVSGEGRQSLFRNPEDQIYEEPEEIAVTEPEEQKPAADPAPLKPKSRNTSGTFRKVKNVFERPNSIISPGGKGYSRYEIHKNTPSQSRDPSYVRNSLPSTSLNSTFKAGDDAQTKTPPSKNGIEIRSDDIRAATSMRLKDRSPKLPTPTVVSDRPRRPIVSFERDYQPRQIELPTSTASAPVMPTTNVPESPTIALNGRSAIPFDKISNVPSISVSEVCIPIVVTPESAIPSRPLPRTANTEQAAHSPRPLPHHSSTAPVSSSKSHWTPVLSRATAQCAACALPIAGRIVSAASQRFHPACFSCFLCDELLECVAFYPEPDASREARLARISARFNNQRLAAEEAAHNAEDDGDDGLRFYCHLDFHENFSPRCRSCKTPIEGEVVVACGGEWHVGHFFCAECGDPFDANTPFVEKDGFAWCVDCHTRRYSGKCAGCRKPVTDMVVNALGKEWHEGCFCCKECGGKFEDGRFFTRRG